MSVLRIKLTSLVVVLCIYLWFVLFCIGLNDVYLLICVCYSINIGSKELVQLAERVLCMHEVAGPVSVFPRFYSFIIYQETLLVNHILILYHSCLYLCGRLIAYQGVVSQH